MAGVDQATTSPVAAIEGIYRRESRRVFATLVRLPGDFDLPRMAPGAMPMPFDGKRVIYGGFRVILEA